MMARIGRNSPCPCGSGKKYKRCCGALDQGHSGPAGDPAGGEQIDTLERASRSGDSRAAVRLGLRYLMARDAPDNPARGMALMEQAAMAGDAQGAYLAATIASCFFWRVRNWDEAFDFLMRAARQGHDAAQSSLRILAGGPSGNNIEGEDWAGPPTVYLTNTADAPPEPRAMPAFEAGRVYSKR